MIKDIERKRWTLHLNVTSTFSWSYIAAFSYAVKRKTSKFKCLTVNGASSDWVGNGAWGSPIVALAPPKEVAQCLTT